MGFSEPSAKTLARMSWITIFFAFALMAYLLFAGLWAKAFLTGAVIIPALLLISWPRLKIPRIYTAIYVLITLYNVLCMGFDLYAKIPYFDELAHAATGFSLAPCLGYLVLGRRIESFYGAPYLLGFLAFCMAVTVGAGWEVLEYILKVEADYADTITDLFADAVGGLLSSLWLAKRIEAKAFSHKGNLQ